ncbi:hypothetical protein [Actinocorallia libanotica]|uniref:C2H2-type domain-containing protein n=1 Tax=Actinocorallia libanotica TaxID=46162 RepID=A0ABN1S0S7_9ACTN
MTRILHAVSRVRWVCVLCGNFHATGPCPPGHHTTGHVREAAL